MKFYTCMLAITLIPSAMFAMELEVSGAHHGHVALLIEQADSDQPDPEVELPSCRQRACKSLQTMVNAIPRPTPLKVLISGIGCLTGIILTGLSMYVRQSIEAGVE